MTQSPNNEPGHPRPIDDLVRPNTRQVQPGPGVVVMSASQAEDLTRRLTMANMALRRGETVDARRQGEELIALYPQAAAVHELLGDVLASLGDHPGAIRSYRQALVVEPGRPTAEIKLGRSAIKTTEMIRRSKIGVAYPGMEGVGVGGSTEDSRRSAKLALVCSAIVPGLGQMLTGRVTPGIVMAVSYFIGTLIVGVLPGTKAAMASAFRVHGGSAANSGAEMVSGFFCLLLIGLWIYSMVDAARNAGQAGPMV